MKSDLLVKGIEKQKEEEKEQNRLHKKYKIDDEKVKIVEKSNMTKFTINTVGRIVRTFAVISILFLATVGLVSLIYPVTREFIFDIFKGVKDFSLGR